MTDHNPVLNIFGDGTGGSIADGGPFYKCMVEGCTDRVVILRNERGKEVPTHVAPDAPDAGWTNTKVRQVVDG